MYWDWNFFRFIFIYFFFKKKIVHHVALFTHPIEYVFNIHSALNLAGTVIIQSVGRNP